MNKERLQLLAVALTGVVAVAIVAFSVAAWAIWWGRTSDIPVPDLTCSGTAACTEVASRVQTYKNLTEAVDADLKSVFDLVVTKGLLDLFAKLATAVLTFIFGKTIIDFLMRRWSNGSALQTPPTRDRPG